MTDAAALPLPPDKWDRHDVRWSPRWARVAPWPNRRAIHRLMWDSAEVQMTLTHRELAERGPFTEEDDDE